MPALARYTAEALIKFIGVAELMGALGLILPAATRIKPFLTPLEATGFVAVAARPTGTERYLAAVWGRAPGSS
jgi:hypothetical protein